MTNIGLCFLAYGDEHILECKSLINEFKKKLIHDVNYYVATDSPEKFVEKNINVIEIKETFNYNHKLIPIEHSLNNCDTVIFLDSDITIKDKSIDFLFLKDIDDGLYASHAKHIRDNGQYQKKLYKLKDDNNDLLHIFEHIIILKLTNTEKKISFIKNWLHIHNQTKEHQPNSKGCNGSQEGLIISLSCIISGIPVIDYETNEKTFKFFNFFHHYCNELDKTKYIT